MASRGQAPVVPVAVSDSTDFPTLPFKSRWKGPGAHIRFGRPIRFRADYRHARHEDLRKMTDEAMYVLATMLPPEQRGVYSDLSQLTQDTIEWI